MHWSRIIVACLACLAAASAPAQWLNYPTPGVPRTTDGKPNLKAPTPRTADGHPDFSGVWLAERNLPCPAQGCLDMEISQEFNNIGWSLKDKLPLQPWAAALVKERQATNSRDDPGSHCLPTGLVKEHTSPFYRRMAQVPGMILILTERDVHFRQIFTDGRPLPEDPLPTPYGYSTGKWQGDTLVVETNGISDGQWLDRMGNPLTSAAHITERFRRPSYGRLDIELTIDDPKAYTRPWTITLHQNIAVNTELMAFFCLENEKDNAHLVGK